MKYFTIGPIQMHPKICKAGGEQSSYFRDDTFAKKTICMQRELIDLVNASADSKIAMLSGCGTTAMETSVLNFTRKGSEVIVINCGSFGRRFVDICKFHGRVVHEFETPLGQAVNIDQLSTLFCKNIHTVFVTAHETSTGQKIDLEAVGELCRSNDALLVCDAVSAIGADNFEMFDWGINVTVFSSNKGLGLAPGIGFLVADPKALNIMICDESFVLDLDPYFTGAERGQPPYTPPIGVLMQLDAQLARISALGGIHAVISNVEKNAQYFRNIITNIGITSFPENPSNAITSFKLLKGNSSDLFDHLKSNYNVLINKTAYGLGVDLPRISHLGDLKIEDHHELFEGIRNYLQKLDT